MKKIYAFYCSGGASRILKFYHRYSLVDFPVSFVYYDGGRSDIIKELSAIFGECLVLNSDDTLATYASTSDKLLYLLSQSATDYLFCFGDRILKSPLIDIYNDRIINFHPSLLPAFPGLNAIDKALNSSVQILGNTAHFIDSGIDTGPIIMQSAISRGAYQDYESVLSLQLDMLFKIWSLLDNEAITLEKNKVLVKSVVKTEAFYTI